MGERSATYVPPPSADVSVVKNVSISGTNISYTLLISNAGPDAANGETYLEHERELKQRKAASAKD